MTATPAPDQPLYRAAHQLHAHGINIIPVRSDGTKAPALKTWQQHTTTEHDIENWFGTGHHTALGIVTGPLSGNLELAEIEGPDAYQIPALAELATASGLQDLWTTINTGWLEQSPSGGIHWLYRVAGDPIPGNTKLAMRPSTDQELADWKEREHLKAAQVPDPGKRDARHLRIHDATNADVPHTIAETRGTGGQVVAAPTGGHAHDSGRPWLRLAGGPHTVPTISPEQRAAFHDLLCTLDTRGITPATTPAQQQPVPATGLTGMLATLEQPRQLPAFEGTTPGDDFENKTTWPEILEPAGWTAVFQRGKTTYWRRPGKDIGFSATTGHADDRDRLYVFSSSTEFPTFEPITKFGAYALMHHGGDHALAAGQLRKDGHGEPQRVQHPAAALQPATTPAAAPHGTIGNLAYLPDPEAPRPHLTIVPSDSLALTDDANAMELIRRHGDKLRYNADQGRWLAWNGHRWEVQPSHGGYARELAKDTARNLPENGPEGADKMLKHKRYSLSERGISSILNQARTDELITVSTNDLDAHPWELNTPGGIVDLRTGTLGPSDPAKLHTRTTAATPDPTANPQVWDTFLKATFPEESLRAYVQRLAGYSSIGEVLAHILPFAFGSGGNGKGVLLEALRGVLGSYAGAAPAGFLMATQYQGHATELADLQGRRFVICSEVNEDDKFDEEKIKRLTGGDTVKARFMRQDFFEFRPTHHLWLMGNHQPAVESGGDSFWRRLRLIPFTHSVAEADIVEDLQGILAREHGPAVLNWIIAGAVDFATGGLQEPTEVRTATKQYAQDVDTVGRFLEDECLIGPSYAGQSTPINTIREAYERWCAAAGEKSIGGRPFTSQLARHGVLTGRAAPRATGGQRLYGGIMLQPRQEHADPFGGDRGGH